MPRPTKRRRICGLPEGKIFVCADACKKQAEPVVMTLEEYETMKRRMEQMEKEIDFLKGALKEARSEK